MNKQYDFRREVWGMERCVFSVQPPEEHIRAAVFAERDNEFERVQNAVLDSPKNILLSGLFGIGKTIFLQELVSQLNENYEEQSALAIYECLDNRQTDLLTTILRGLANHLSEEGDKNAKEIVALLAGIELQEEDSRKQTSEANLGVGTLSGKLGEEEASKITRSRKIVPNAPYQIKKLLEDAKKRQPHRRIVVVIDDLDKCDPETVREALLDARSTLHLPCAFVLTGHPLSVLRNIFSTAGGVFDNHIMLPPMSPSSLKTVMRKYLEAGRVAGATQQGWEPFTEESVEAIIPCTYGIPRLLNIICLKLIEQATIKRLPIIDINALSECWEAVHHELQRDQSASSAQLIEMLREGFDPSNPSDEAYSTLQVDSRQDMLVFLDTLVRSGIVIGVERAGKTIFHPAPFQLPFQRENLPLLPLLSDVPHGGE